MTKMSTNNKKFRQQRANSICGVWNNVDKIFNKDEEYLDHLSEDSRKKMKPLQDKIPDKTDWTPDEIVDFIGDLWSGQGEGYDCAVNYEIGDSGTHHCHLVLEAKQSFRYSKPLNMFPTTHIELTKGTKEEVTAYFTKSGKYEEKSHTVVIPMKMFGEIRAAKANNQGRRTDLETIQQMLEEGCTPEDIMSNNLAARQYSKMIHDHFYQLRLQSAPDHKDNLRIIWHTGDSGSGKSYTQVKLIQKFGREQVYVLSDYQNGGLDNYQGEPYLFMEEFKGEIPFGEFLKITDRYPQQMHARYSNVYALWTEVHISSIFSPRQIYNIMVPEEKRDNDVIKQMMRRINKVVYHFTTTEADEVKYKTLTFSTEDFNNLSKEKIEEFAYKFDEWNKDVLDFNFTKDAFYNGMNPIKNTKKHHSKRPAKNTKSDADK